jgi:hypothetical protein
MSTQSPLLKKLSTRYTIMRSVEVLLIALAAGLLVWAITDWIATDTIGRTIGVTLGAAFAALLSLMRTKILSPAAPFLIRHLNNRYPQLQASADLLLADESTLSLIQKIQLARVQSQLQLIYPEIKLPHQLRIASLTLLGSVAISALLMAFQSASKKETDELVNQVQATAADPQAARLNSLQVTITPPAYTGLASRKAEDANLNVQQNSKVVWSAKFSTAVQAWLVFSGRDSIALTEQGKVYTAQKIISEAGFYQLAWNSLGKTVYTDFFKIEVIKDQAPQIEITNLEQFTRLKQTDSWSVPVKTNLRDDYGLTDAQIIATVSKGSGESVKVPRRKATLQFTTNYFGETGCRKPDYEPAHIGSGARR